MARRGDFSGRLANRPELWPGTLLYWRAFEDLHADCGSGGAISWQVMRGWSEANGLGEDQFADLVFILRAMGAAYAEWQRKHEPRHRPGTDNEPR